MTKKEIVRSISDKLGLTRLKTKEILQNAFEAITETIAENGRIELRNFGVFEIRHRGARKAHNPKTGEEVAVKEKYVVVFKAGKAMDDKIRTRMEKKKK